MSATRAATAAALLFMCVAAHSGAAVGSGARLLALPHSLWPPAREIVRVPEPLEANPNGILVWPQASWRDARFEVFRWHRFPSLLIVDTADYATQDRLFKRLAFYVEKTGFRGRLSRDEEIAGLHGWNGYDFRADDLARFFQRARDEGFPLNREELELEQILLDEGTIRETPGGLLGGHGGVFSISREAPEFLRFLLMAHEGFHGLFFIDEGFRAFTADRWERFAPEGRRMFLTFLADQEYDTSEEFIVHKEFAAFLLQQPLSQTAFYFGRRVPYRITDAQWHADHRHLRAAGGSFPFFANLFSREVAAFEAFVAERWGFVAGRVW